MEENIDLIIENSTLTELVEFPKNLTSLTIKNTPLTLLPKLPENLVYLYIDNVPITKLPELPKSLRFLRVHNTKLAKLPSLSPTLLYLKVSNNQIAEFPRITRLLKGLTINNNKIKHFPPLEKFKNLKSLRIENNPGSLQYYKVSKLNKNNISNKNDIPTLTLKKGTVLFHNMEAMENIYDMYLGIKVGDSYVMNFNSQVYFMPHPFHTVAYGKMTTICVLQNDIKVILGVKPSELTREDITRLKYFDRENCESKPSLLESRYDCPGDNIIQNNIMGWISITFNPTVSAVTLWHAESNHFQQYYKYVSYYKNSNGILDRPEIMMHPYKRRLNKDVIVKESEAFEASLLGDKTWLDKNEQKFNYKIIEIIENNQDFKSYKSVIDKFLSKAGHNGYHMFRNEKDGFYMIQEFI